MSASIRGRTRNRGMLQPMSSSWPCSEVGIYTPRWKAEAEVVVGTGTIGNPEAIAKNRVRTEIAEEMLGNGADLVKVAERTSSLLKKVKCGEFINDTLNGVDASLKMTLNAIIPWEKMVKRGGAQSRVS